MQQKKDTKRLLIQTFALAVFIFARSVLFINESRIGFSIADSSFAASSLEIIIIMLLAVVSFLAAFTVSAVDNRLGKESRYIFALIIADLSVLLMCNNGLSVLVTITGLVFILFRTRKPGSSFNELLLSIVIFVSAFLMPYSVFCFVPLFFTVNFMTDIDGIIKNKKRIVSVLLYVVCAVAGVVWNKIVFAKSVAFEKFLVTFSFNDYMAEESNKLFLLTCIPMIILAVFFFLGYIRRAENSDDKKRIAAVISIVIFCYVLALTGFITSGTKTICTINLITPVAILALLAGKDAITKSIINDFNTFVEKHILFAVLIYGGYVWFITVILKNSFDIRSIVSHII